MELSIRDWMVVIGVLLLLAVGLDGYRRSQKERQNRVRVSRAAKRRAKQSKPQQDPAFQSSEEEDDDDGFSRLNNADLGISRPASDFDDVAEEYVTTNDSYDALAPAREEELAVGGAADSNDAASSYEEVDPLFENPFEVEASRLPELDQRDKSSASAVENRPDTESFADVDAGYDAIASEDEKQKGEYQHSLLFESDREVASTKPAEILVLNVLSNNAQGFSGEDLQHILRACDCRFGEMNIFHRYEGENARGQVQFSIVNMVEPGVFDLDDIKSFSTRGVSFFLRLPGPEDPVEAYNCMVEVAQCLVRNLDGVLKDDMHSAVTEQTLEHNRQCIRDYQQRELLAT